jgi:uncharacterized membrane protein
MSMNKEDIVEPHYYTIPDFLKALFGAFFIALTFLFKGSMVEFSSRMSTNHAVFVILLTCIAVTGEIYLLSYKFVRNRKERPFYEFWAKRFFTITTATFATIYFAIYLYGINAYVSQIEAFKLASAVFMPAAIFGAAIELLKEKY